MVNYCFALPYIKGGLELAKKFAQENINALTAIEKGIRLSKS
jgi:hypothetical protein